jgi:hypothetical protein
MPVLADNDVIMHRYAERTGDVDDRAGHLDVRLRWRRIAGRMVVHDTAASTIVLKKKNKLGRLCCVGTVIGSGSACSDVILTLLHQRHHAVALMHGMSPYSFDPTHQAR